MHGKRSRSPKRSCAMRRPTWKRSGRGSIGKRMAGWSGNEKRALIQDSNPKALVEVSTAIIAETEADVNDQIESFRYS